jgi:hypothetical protein
MKRRQSIYPTSPGLKQPSGPGSLVSRDAAAQPPRRLLRRPTPLRLHSHGHTAAAHGMDPWPAAAYIRSPPASSQTCTDPSAVIRRRLHPTRQPLLCLCGQKYLLPATVVAIVPWRSACPVWLSLCAILRIWACVSSSIM